MTNDDRANRAEAGLKAYWSIGNGTDFDDEIDVEDKLPAPMIDFLTDLHHWAERKGVDFEHILEMAGGHYEAEKEEEIMENGGDK